MERVRRWVRVVDVVSGRVGLRLMRMEVWVLRRRGRRAQAAVGKVMW